MIPDKSYKPNNCKVAIRNNKNIIALRYSYKQKQVDLSLGLSWLDNVNHQKAIAIAQQIHNDIFLFGDYDETREKYKIKKSRNKDKSIEIEKQFNLNDCVKFYFNKAELADSKKAGYDRLNKLLSVKIFEIEDLPNFVELALETYSKSTIEHDLRTVSASINLAKKYRKHDKENLAYSLINDLKKRKIKKQIKIFSQDEVKLILDAFKENKYVKDKSIFNHSYYYHFVAIRFLTGMRPSEAIALTWNDIVTQDNKQWLKIDKRFINREIKQGTKNGIRIRLFPINEQLKQLLDNIPKSHDKLLFPSQKGNYIDCQNFVNRYWQVIVKGLVKDGLVKEYLPFYDIRHTFISHMARSNKIDLKTLGAICGNSVETIIKNYLAIDTNLKLPNLFQGQ